MSATFVHAQPVYNLVYSISSGHGLVNIRRFSFVQLARLAMTAVILSGGRSNEVSPLTFTLLDTIRIVAFPLLFGIPMALVLVALWPSLPGSGWAKAISAGVVTLVFPSLVFLQERRSEEALLF